MHSNKCLPVVFITIALLAIGILLVLNMKQPSSGSSSGSSTKPPSQPDTDYSLMIGGDSSIILNIFNESNFITAGPIQLGLNSKITVPVYGSVSFTTNAPQGVPPLNIDYKTIKKYKRLKLDVNISKKTIIISESERS